MRPMIAFKDVHLSFDGVPVLDGLDLEVAPGERVAVIGSSGSGKSTLLRALMTLQPIDSGMIEVDGEPVWHMRRNGKLVPANQRHLRKMRRNIGMVFQSFNLFPHMSVLRNLTEAPIHVLGLSKQEATARAEELLDMVGLAEKKDAYPSQLSGGQQQRVAIARALAMRPKVMLFDEVTSALDPETVGEVLNVIRELATRHELTMMMVTHEIAFARDVAHRICFLCNGRIEEEGPPEQMFTNPRSPKTRHFLRTILEGGPATPS